MIPSALTIAGSDSGANAGIQADLLTFAAHGVYGTTAITCLTAQNPSGVSAIHAAPADCVAQQISQVLAYYPIAAIKTGMLFNREIIETVAALLAKNSHLKLVVDPVSVATSGAVLLQPDAIAALTEKLLPLATVITPNLDEAELLLSRPIRTPEEIENAARDLAKRFQTIALVKGGHLEGDTLIDSAATPDGTCKTFTQTRIQKVDTHGSGCTLSSAITANLALGKEPLDAIDAARAYLRSGMTHPLCLPQFPFINHFPK